MEESQEGRIAHTLALIVVVALLILAAKGVASLADDPPTWASQTGAAVIAIVTGTTKESEAVKDELSPALVQCSEPAAGLTKVNYACAQIGSIEKIKEMTQTCSPGFVYLVTVRENKVSVSPRPAADNILSCANKAQSKTCNSGESAVKSTSKSPCQIEFCYSGYGDCKQVQKDIKPGTSFHVEDVLKEGLENATAEQLNNLGIPGNVSAAEQKAWNEVLYPAKQATEQQIKTNEAAIDQLKAKIDSCNPECRVNNGPAVLKAQQAELEKQNAALQERVAVLAEAQKRLQPPADKIKTPQTPTQQEEIQQQQPQNTFTPGNKFPQPPTNPTGNPSSNTGGLQGLLQSLLQGLTGQSGEPPAGNQQPQQANDCSPKLLCSGNTLYSRNNQCVDSPVQTCPYGCKSTTECAPAPQQCPPAPAWPDSAGCANGTWKSTKTGNCATGWQCVPSGNSETGSAPTAQLSCQPQVADVGMTLAITWGCSAGKSVGGGFVTNGKISGATSTTIMMPLAGSNIANFGLTCTDKGLTSSTSCTVQAAKPAIVLVANPKSVELGEKASIGWVTASMKECIISSPSQPNFTAENAGKKNANGVATTDPINGATNFLLTCTTVGGNTREATTTVVIK